MKFHRSSSFVLLLVAASAAPAWPEQSAQPPTFRTRVDAVTVDVSTTDSQGRPVTDLTVTDFEIKESGKVQSIDSFKRFTVDEIPPGRPPVPIASMEAQQREAARDDVRLIAIFLDDYHTRTGNAMAAREKLARFITGLDPRDMVAVMYPLTPSNALTFSRDHEGTARAVRKFEGRKYNHIPRYPQEDVYVRLSRRQIEDLRNEIVIDAVAGLCTVLGSFRDGRKTVLMVSEGLTSFLPGPIATRGQTGARAPDNAATPSEGPGQNRLEFSRMVDLQNRMRDIFTAAARTNTSVYTWDPRGLPVFEFELSEPGVDLVADRRMLQETTDSLRTIAGETGGRAIVNANDPVSMLRQMLVDTGAYYLLGYTSTEAPRDGNFHEIVVHVKRKGIEVRARKGYWAYSPEDAARAARPDRPPLPSGMAGALASAAAPATGHAIRTWIGSDRTDVGGQSTVTIVWELVPDSSRVEPPDHVGVTVSTKDGELIFRGRSPRDPAAVSPSGRLTFTTRPGAIQVRVSVEGTSGQFLDREERVVQVPDFTAVGPIVTIPEIYRARTARELQQIRESNTALPTAIQQFSRTDQLLVRFRTYGPGGTTPEIVVRLRNSQGETISTLPAPQQRPDGRFEVPFLPSALMPGVYVIEIAAASGGDSTRAFWGFAIKAR
jgi:VWFA-related protein